MKHNSHLVQLAENPKIRVNRAECLKRGIQDGDQVRLSANNNTILAQIKEDAKVADETCVLPLGFEECPVQELGLNLKNGLAIEIRKD